MEYFWHVYPKLCDALKEHKKLPFAMVGPLSDADREAITEKLRKRNIPLHGPTSRPYIEVAQRLEDAKLKNIKEAFDALDAARASVAPIADRAPLFDDERSWF